MAESTFLGSVYATAELRTDKFDADIQGVEDKLNNLGDKAQSGLGKALSVVGEGFKEIGKVGLIAGTALAGFATFSGMAAARVDELTLALHTIAKANNVSTEAADASVAALRANNIAMAKALQITAYFISANLDLSDAIKLSNAAKDLAVVAGLDSSTATEMLTDAIVTNQTQQLQQFGILTTQTQAYKDYGAAIGKSATDLTQHEKQMALLNIVLAQGEKVAGTYEAAYGSVSKRFRSLTGRILPDFIAMMGRPFEPAMAIVVDSVISKIGIMTKWVTDNKATLDSWGEKLAGVIKIGVGMFGKIFDWLIENKEVLVGALVALGVGMAVLGASFLVAHAPAILLFGAITLIAVAIQKLPPAVLLGIAAAITTVGVAIAVSAVPAFIAWATAAWTAAAGVIAATWPILLLALAIGLVVAGIYLLITNWTAVSTFLTNIWTSIVNTGIALWTGLATWISTTVQNLVTGIITFFAELPGNILRILIDVKNWFVNKWNEIWDWLKTNIPLIVKDIQDWLSKLPGIIKDALISFKNSAVEGFTNTWNAIVAEVKTWPGRMYDWGKNIMQSFADGIKAAIGAIADAFKAGMEGAKKLVKGSSPPVAGPFKDIDVWGFNVGKAWVEGVQKAVGALTIPSPSFGSTSLTQLAPAPVYYNQTHSPKFEVNVGIYAGSEMERRNLAKQLFDSYADYQKGAGLSVTQ